jgi:methyl-accepting chemotaxis protein
MSLSRLKLKKLILEEIERLSEMEEFSESKSGKSFMKEGDRIKNSAKKLFELGRDQTGEMGKTIKEIARFINKVGESISSINDLSESGTESKLPSVQEFKQMIKAINKLES